VKEPRQASKEPVRFYDFYFDDDLEGEHTYRIVLDNDVPHRLQKYHESAYAGAMNLGRGWGRIFIPEGELERFMELTGNRLAPEPDLHIDEPAKSSGSGCLQFGVLALILGAFAIAI